MVLCVKCGLSCQNYICSDCLKKVNLDTLILTMIEDFKKVDRDNEKVFYNNQIDNNLLENIVFNLTQYLEVPRKDYYRILSLFKKKYIVAKDRRDWLYTNTYSCLNSNLANFEKNIIRSSLLDAYYYLYDEAEIVAIKLSNEDILDEFMLFTLSEYYIYTRRYDQAFNFLDKAWQVCNDENYKKLIEDKILDAQARVLGKKQGGKNPYLPLGTENREKYALFMNKLNIDISNIKKRQPEKIPVGSYPIPVEHKKADFNSFVAFDVETTGLDFKIESITELAAIRVVDGKVVEAKEFIFQELVHPYKRKIPRNVEDLTGITNEMVKDKREIWEVFKDFVDFLGDDILVGYNCMAFDSKFLVRAGRLSNLVIENRYFDVMHYVDEFRGILRYDRKTLTNISELLGIHNPNAHRALADAITTAKVYLKLKALKKEMISV